MSDDRSSTMWKDVSTRLDLARHSLETKDYAATIRESQAAIERIVKSVLDGLEVDYKKKHDVSTYIPEAYKKLKDRLDPSEIYHASTTLATAAVLLRLLTSIKEYSEWSMKEMGVSGRELFTAGFAADLSKLLLESVTTHFIRVQSIMGKYVWGPI